MNADKIKEIRKLNQLTQTQFANKIGVSLATIAKWESGKYPIPETKQKLIKSVFIYKNYIENNTKTINQTLNEAEEAFLNKEISEEEIATTVRNLVIHEKELEASLLFRTWRERLRVEAKNEALLEYMNSRK